MASVLTTPSTSDLGMANRRLLTSADLAVLPESLPSGDVRYELNSGVLRIMAPAGDLHGASQSKFITELSIQGERRGLGKVRCEVGVILQRNPDTVYGPDALFVSTRSLPLRIAREGYLETIPELVVEVRSKNDTLAELQQKTRDYLKAGVTLVWIADPISKTVAVHRTGAEPKVLAETDTLTADEVIPDFRVALADLFRD